MLLAVSGLGPAKAATPPGWRVVLTLPGTPSSTLEMVATPGQGSGLGWWRGLPGGRGPPAGGAVHRPVLGTQ